MLVISVLSSGTVVTDPELVAPTVLQRYSGLLVANTFSILLCWLYIELVDRTFFKNKVDKAINIFWVLAFGASLGFLKGYTTGVFSWLVGSETDFDSAISSRIYQTTLLGIWTVPLVAIVAATFARYQQERQLLLSEKVESALRGPVDLLSEETSGELSAFITKSKEELATFRNDMEVSDRNKQIAQKLRDLVEQGLRPISHKIWDNESRGAASFSLLELSKVALRTRPFPLRIIAAGFTLGLLPINLAAYDLVEALIRTAMMVLVTIAIFASVKLIKPKTIKQVFAVFWLANFLAASLGPIAADLVLQTPILVERFPAWLALLLWLAQLSFFASVASEVINSRAEIRTQLLELVGEAGLESQVRMAISKLNNRELAQYVHGNLQNRLLSSALKLESENLSRDQVIAQLNEVEALLDGALSDYRSASIETLDFQLNEITKRWAGFVKLNIQNQLSSSSLSKETVKAIVQVVSEAVSNSVRHGLAKSLSVTIGNSSPGISSFIEITIKDDGLGPRSGKAGLGTELFTAISGGSWSITQLREGGTELKLRIKP
jgi:signal transduction histidine kinase